MQKRLTLEYYKTDNGYLIEHTGSGSTPHTSQYVFNEWDGAEKKLIEILSEAIDVKLIKKDDAESIVRSLIQTREENINKLVGRMLDTLRKIREL